MLAEATRVQRLRKSMGKLCTSPATRLGNAMAAIHAYDLKLAEFTKTTSAIAVHSDRLRAFKAFCEEVEKDCVQAEEIERLMKMCQEASFLMAELPAKSIDNLTDTLVARVEKTCKAFLGAGPGEMPGKSCQIMQNMICEACIAFPFQATLEEFKQKLGRCMSDAAACQRLATLVEKYVKLIGALGTEGWSNMVAEVQEAAKQAEGVEMDETQKQKIAATSKDMLEFIPTCVDSCSDEALELLEVTQMLKPNGHPLLSKAVYEELKMMLELGGSIVSWNQKLPNLEERLAADLPKKEHLSEVVRALKRAEQKGKIAHGDAVLKRLIGEGTTIVEYCKNSELEAMLKTTKQLTQELAAIGGGMVDGSSWDRGLGWDSPWSALVQQAKLSILDSEKFDAEKLDEKMNELAEA